MIKLNNKEITKNQLNSYLRKKMWLGEKICDIYLVEEHIDTKVYPYIFLAAIALTEHSEHRDVDLRISLKIRIFLINALYKIRRFIEL